MKNLDKKIQIANDLKNGIVNGVKVEFVPEKGMGVQQFVGSDTYGYEILSVTEDRTAFSFGHRTAERMNVVGQAALVTRANSKNYGKYREAILKTTKDGRLKFVPIPTCTGVRCGHIGNVYLTGTQGEAETFLDPSF